MLGETVNQNKGSSGEHIFTPVCKYLAQNSKYPLLQKLAKFLQHLGNQHLKTQQMA